MAKNIDEYHSNFPEDIRRRLEAVRDAIRDCSPTATEKIAYGIPTFYLEGNLVHYAGYLRHIGFYPAPSALLAFESQLLSYKRAKGSVQFPHDRELPIELIKEMVEFRVREKLRKGDGGRTI